MAWPCITRVCCLARFWNQLDKSDLAVPLTLHNYSDIEEAAEEGGGAEQQSRLPTGGGPGRPRGHPRPASALPVSASAPSLQDSLAGVKRPSRKGRGGGGGGGGGGCRKESFAAETQYQQDFRAWPVQKRDALPWIGEGGRGEPAAAAASPAVGHGGPHVYVLPTSEQGAGGKRSGFKQMWASVSPPGVRKTTAYRQEYRSWTGAKRSRASKAKRGFIIPEDHFVRETSYKADFKSTDAVMLILWTLGQVYRERRVLTPGLHHESGIFSHNQRQIPEAKTKFSPNPSAVFQVPSRILNV